ncbi:AlpA family phage regulatory protein [Microbacterium sp. Marseille-Q6648]|uniref:helix-turn-helix transcriptional regulator n=1 Tax=Microbacterium sp. Marseille-Q6648 TaxID=2937991 RepID=UPI00203B352E|nr:AlpA family phage regulatory protein [Microbacterium sp. Marseille-Q6648]
MEYQSVLMTPQEVSQWTGLSIGALAQLRYKGQGPQFVKLTPKTVRYVREQVQAWIDSQMQTQSGGGR